MLAAHSTGYCVIDPKYNVGLALSYFKVDNLKKEPYAYPVSTGSYDSAGIEGSPT